MHGSRCEPAEQARLFRLRATCVLNAGGYLRFRHRRLYGERGLADERAAVSMDGETLTIEYAPDTPAQYRVTTGADGRRSSEIDEPCFFATTYASPNPFLSALVASTWHPARRLALYPPRRRRRDEGQQARLPEPTRYDSAG